MTLQRSIAAALLLSALGAAPARAQLEVVLVTSGLSSPTYLCAAPGDSDRLFVTQQGGQVRVILNGTLRPTPFLTLTISSGGERGLLGLAFHPDYQNNRKFYVSYTNTSGNSVVAQYLRDATDPNLADPGTAQTIFGPITQPFSNHNGGWIDFSPVDGKLYVGLGDGGSGNDPGNRAQNRMNVLGKMLRFDVDIPFPHIPADNPFVGDGTTDDRIWAIGVRNPWRCSFDRLTGDLWIADVGQDAREEVNFEPQGAGGRNYGWRCMEGTNCTGLTGCTCNSPSLTLPVYEYAHPSGCSITGGYRYRGSLMTAMYGRYFLTDYCTGRIFSFAFNGTTTSNLVEHTTDLAIPGSESIASFGEDTNGELYIVDQSGGEIWLMRDECNSATFNYCVTSPNSNGPGAQIYSNGATDISNNAFVLGVLSASSSQPGIFYYGANETQVPFGNGLRCVGGATYRLLPPIFTDPFGDATRALDMTVPPASTGSGAILPGTTWKFQFWYRDPAAGGANFNLSDGLSASFCP